MWQILFTVEQTIFLFALGWFIRLLIKYSKEVKELTKQYFELDKDFGIHKENNIQIFNSIDSRLSKIESKLDQLYKELI